MEHSIVKGLSFGLTSGIITTLGLIVGLQSGTNSPRLVIGGILIIAIADAMSDALGIHISEESESYHTEKEVWVATICTFLAKFIFSSIFIIPVLLFNLQSAIIISVIFGLLLIALFSYYIAKNQSKSPYGIIFEHLLITIIVIISTHYIGKFISNFS